MDLARMQWKNPELEAMEVTLAKEEWNLVNEHLDRILSENDIKEGMKQLLKLNSNGEEIHPTLLKELLFLQKTNRVEYGINVPLSDEQQKQKENLVASLKAMAKETDQKTNVFWVNDTKSIRILSYSFSSHVKLKLKLHPQYPETTSME